MIRAALLLGALVAAAPARAVHFEVLGEADRTVMKREIAADLARNALEITKAALDSAGIPYVATEEGISSVAGLGSRVDEGGTVLKVYGWCYSVNGALPEVMPSELKLQSQSDTLRWFYAFAELSSEGWRQCVTSR